MVDIPIPPLPINFLVLTLKPFFYYNNVDSGVRGFTAFKQNEK